MKTLKALIIVVLVLVAIPMIGFAVWFLQRGENLEVFLVNKSMTSFNGSENKAMNYILNKEKIFTPGNRKYDLTMDHYGLMWDKGDYHVKYPRLKDLERTVEKSDLLYFADAKGIMVSDIRKLMDGEEDQVEYGGLNNTDYTFLRYFKESGKPAILECSFFGSPTEPLVRYNLEQLTDVYYVGWLGKYTKDLSEDADLLVGYDYKLEYERITGESWDASGPGIIMLNPDAGRIVVLEEGSDFKSGKGIIHTGEEMAAAYNLPDEASYCGWFAVLHPGRNEVISTFELNPTAEGIEKLRLNGLPESFPALIANENLYFMAGDFGKCKVNLLLSRVIGVRDLISVIRRSGAGNPNNFFYSYYQPFVAGLINSVEGGAE